jgi:NTE family protein
MIGLALSGGGSRAIAFHLGCLRGLDAIGLLDRIDVLSTISGGSVIGAYYAYTPWKSFTEFEEDVRGFLKSGFQRAILYEYRLPRNAFWGIANTLAATIDVAQERLFKRSAKFRGWPSRTDLFQTVLQRQLFPNLRMNSDRRRDLEVVIGACDLRTESAFRFGNSKSGSWRLGTLAGEPVDVALAVASSAAYPLLLPALDRKWQFVNNNAQAKYRVLLSDGGLYDNLGVQVLEPGRNPDFSLHTFSCDYLIVCNAGHGQVSGENVPGRLFGRMATSFSMVHRRVGNAAMHRLHELAQSKQIKGFALPYLGVDDTKLPTRPRSLVRRSEVIGYPTDFAAMSDNWIDALSTRGEQLTRILVGAYLKELLT